MPGRPTGIGGMGAVGSVSARSVSQSGAGEPGGERVTPSHAYKPAGEPNRTPPCWPTCEPTKAGRQTFALAQYCGPCGEPRGPQLGPAARRPVVTLVLRSTSSIVPSDRNIQPMAPGGGLPN